MKVARTIKSVRQLVIAARGNGEKIGLVPTMGALHEGHRSLIMRSVKAGNFTVVSVFVNPTQFGPREDFNKYPRPIRDDLKICRDTGVNVVFVPTAKEIYSGGTVTWVEVEKMSKPMCGQFRPGHFRGVATVCAKLFNIVQPDVAYFGQKDAQQAAIIKRMVADLNFPLKIVVCPTVRAADGLALSSRNRYLSTQQRRDATCIYRSLAAAREMIKAGVKAPKTIAGRMRKILEKAGSLTGVDYISVVNPDTLEEMKHVEGKVLIAVAARIGSTRLIDNLIVDADRR
ncbi:MAG: pantoate--beta-alanine ligase [Sedimentisphaerales bacterium]|nr:pantoate--beta-alanine ligase [Sedimentisphaerales bacterium]